MWLKRTGAESTAGAASFSKLRGTLSGAVMTRRAVRAGTRRKAGRARSLGLESVCPLSIWRFPSLSAGQRQGSAIRLFARSCVWLTNYVICQYVASASDMSIDQPRLLCGACLTSDELCNMTSCQEDHAVSQRHLRAQM